MDARKMGERFSAYRVNSKRQHRKWEDLNGKGGRQVRGKKWMRVR